MYKHLYAFVWKICYNLRGVAFIRREKKEGEGEELHYTDIVAMLIVIQHKHAMKESLHNPM